MIQYSILSGKNFHLFDLFSETRQKHEKAAGLLPTDHLGGGIRPGQEIKDPRRGREVRRCIYDFMLNDHSRFIRFSNFHKIVEAFKYYYNMIDNLARVFNFIKFSNE